MDKLLDAPSKPILSLCMIVKNESENLPRCLASAKAYVDEIIVVDTGSQDGTPEIALEYGANVSYFEWCDDFAAARNYAIAQASGDWILMLDADEELIVESEDFLGQFTSHPEIIAYTLISIDIDDQAEATPSYRTLLFRNISELRYVDRFHEGLKYQNKNISVNQRRHLNSLKILHYGFSKEKLLQKNISRNIPMLESIREESGLSLMLLYCLSRMYADSQQPEKAQKCYAEIFDRLLPNLMDGNPPDEFVYVPSLIYTLARYFFLDEDYETTRVLCQRGLEWCPNYAPLNCLAGGTLRILGFPLGAVAYFKKCLQMGRDGSYYKGESFDLSFMTTYPAYDLGNTYIDLERPQEALAAFELALSFDANFTAASGKIDMIKNLLAT